MRTGVCFFEVHAIDCFGDELLLFCGEDVSEVCFWGCGGGGRCIIHIHVYQLGGCGGGVWKTGYAIESRECGL